ncbi:MAG: oxidoreductase [Methanomassiliicoccaceae archaeon]|jgi:F420-non-reducing hydrogenase small subunit|nr:oxidoreductase [Methanomassiliicoccaceae archaeon]
MGFFDRLFNKHPESCKCGCKDDKKEAKKDAKAAPTKAAPGKALPVKAAPKEAVNPLDAFPLLPGAPPGGKIKLAIYWAAGCGGCDVSLLDTAERILTVSDMAEIVMWPIAADGKEKDIEAMKDQEITVSIINGAVRNTENEHMVKLLRKKSLLVVSYGTCACFGGSPALANLVPGGKDEIIDYVYKKCPTMKAFQDTQKTPVVPKTSVMTPDGEITIPELYDTVKSLDQTIDVDYSIPGCPPTQESIAQLLAAVAGFVYNGVALPPKGTMIGVTAKTLCEECPRKKEMRRITKIVEPHEIDVDPELCLMDQGILCLGAATVGGCGAKCTRAASPCRGCYGPTKMVSEMGASVFTAVASLFPVLDGDPTCNEEEIIKIMSSVKDPLGYFYAFTMSKSLIKRSVVEKKKGGQ